MQIESEHLKETLSKIYNQETDTAVRLGLAIGLLQISNYEKSKLSSEMAVVQNNATQMRQQLEGMQIKEKKGGRT